MNKAGSALLLVLVTTSGLLMLSLYAWKHSSMLTDLTTERETFYKNFYKVDGFMQIGSVFVKNNYDQLLRTAMHVRTPLFFDLSYHDKQSGLHKARMTLTLHNKSQDLLAQQDFILSVAAQEHNKTTMTMTCMLGRRRQPKNNGDIHEPQVYFVVHHTTFGKSV